MSKYAATFSIAIILLVISVGAVMVAGQTRYFPEGVLDPASASSDSLENSRYSRQLEAMSEPVLAPESGSRTYRLTWLRTFHHPVAVRVVMSRSRCALHATELDGAGGYAPGRVYRRKVEDIAPEVCSRLEAFIFASGFWDLPQSAQVVGADGSRWIVEGVTTRYRVVERWTPESGPVRAIGQQLLALTGWKYPPKEMY